MADKEIVKWFVAKTRAKQEKAVQRQIEQLGVGTFLPIRTEIRDWHDRKKKVEAVLIPNTVFVHADKQTAIALHNDHGVQVSYLRDMTCKNPGCLLEIPESQMSEFIRFINLSDNNYEVETEEVLYMRGDKVIVNDGAFKGLTGELIRLDGKNKVVVRVDNLIACSVQIAIEQIEKINNLV